MAIETTFTVRAAAKGFTEAAKAVDDLNKRIVNGQKAVDKATGQGGSGRLPKQVGPALPNVPAPRRPMPGTVGGRDPLAPIPANLLDKNAPAGPLAEERKKKSRKASPADIDAMVGAYKRLRVAANMAGDSVQDLNDFIRAGKEDAKAYGAAFRGRGGGGKSGGGSGGGGGGGPPRGPKPPSMPADPKSLKSIFKQGILEALLPGIGPLLDGGEQGVQQFKGRLVGTAARQVGQFAKNTLTAPLYGVQGYQRALSSVPLVGGLLGDAASQQFGNVSNALSFESQQQGALPYLGRTGVRRQNLNAPGMQGMFGFEQLSAMGLRKAGMDGRQSQSYLTALAQASGGTADNPMVGGALPSSLSAMSAYGVGPDVAGSFVQGQRLQGASNSTGVNGLVRSLAAGSQGLGLSGTELTDYMRQMADDIASFKVTGIPIATDSIGALGMTLASTGIAGTRAASMSGSFVKNAQQVGLNGPGSIQDVALLQAVAGRPLKGLEDTLGVMQQVEGGLSPDQAQGAFKNLLGSSRKQFGTSASGQFQRRQYLNQFGFNFNSKEFAGLDDAKNPQLSDEAVANFNQKLNATGDGNVSRASQADAAMQNTSLAMGFAGMQTFLESEKFHKQLAQDINAGVNPLLNAVVKLTTSIGSSALNFATGQSASSPGQAAGRGTFQ